MCFFGCRFDMGNWVGVVQLEQKGTQTCVNICTYTQYLMERLLPLRIYSWSGQSKATDVFVLYQQ